MGLESVFCEIYNLQSSIEIHIKKTPILKGKFLGKKKKLGDSSSQCGRTL